MDGKSLVPLVWNKNTGWREELFLESLFSGRDNPFSEGIRKGKWKYLRMYNGVVNFSEKELDFSNREPEFEQLFNLEEDPGENHNLIHEYGKREILRQLRAKCAEESKRINKEREIYKQHHKTELRKKR